MAAAWSGRLFQTATGVIILSLFFCWTSAIGQALPTDCANAIPVCSNGSINESSNGPGINDFAFPGNNSGCLSGGEHQSVWLYVQIESGTTLEFDIIPRGASSLDYDFAVFGPNKTCRDLGNPIRCSYAAPGGPYGNNTGLNRNENDLSENAGGNGYVRYLDVNPGDTYYILVDNFSSNFQGFTLNWGGDNNLDCSITEECAEIELGNDTTLCNGGSLTLGRNTGPNDDYLWSTGATSPTIAVADSGLYWVAITRGTCTVYDSIYVGLAEAPVIDLGGDTVLCEGDILTLDATFPGATEYLWQDGSASPLFEVTQPGTYSVEVVNAGCSGFGEIEVAYRDIPRIDLGADTLICSGNSLLLNASSPDADSYLWQDGSTAAAFTATQSGLYSVTLSNAACTFSDSISVRFGDRPVFDLGGEIAVCEDQDVLLDATASYAAGYVWQDGTTGPEYEVTASGTYTATAFNNECSFTDSVRVTIINYPQPDLGADTTLCNDATLTLQSGVAALTGTEFLWQDGSTGETFTVSAPGTYSVAVTNVVCAASDTIVIAYNDLPQFSLGPDTVLCSGTPYPLAVEGREDWEFLWQDNSTGSGFTVKEQGLYYVAVSNVCGTASDSVWVRYGSCDCGLWLPTGFTPNNDGVNDVLLPLVDCDSLQSFRMEIFDRWGRSLFKTDDPGQAWLPGGDGEHYPMDAYVWIMEYSWTWRGKLMQRRETGYVTLIR